MKFSIEDFFSKFDQVWSHLLKKSLMENFIFCAVKTERLTHFYLGLSDVFRKYKNGKLAWYGLIQLNLERVCRNIYRRCSIKRCVFKKCAIFTGKHLCQNKFFIKLQASAFFFSKNETLKHVFSCEFCEIFGKRFLKNTSRRVLLENETKYW